MRTELKKGEKVFLIIRHHWLKLVMPFFAWIVIGALSAFLLPASIGLAVILLSGMYPLFAYFTWVHNIWAVTSLRVIDEGGFITRYAKESPLDKINNIVYDQSFWGRLFGYGNVDIQTAAEMGDTYYKMIHHPRALKDTITMAQEAYKNDMGSKQAEQFAKAVAEQVVTSKVQGILVADELKKMFDLMLAGAITKDEYEKQKNKLLSN